MNKDSLLIKIWNIIYPLLAYFLLDMIVVWVAELLLSYSFLIGPDSFLAKNIPTIASMIFLVISIFLCRSFYKKDYVAYSNLMIKPQYIILLVVAGALASHGLSALVSLMNIDQLLGNYTELENTIFIASPVLVVIQTVILAPISEELLFRALIYKRIERYTNSFWISALVSSLLFGVYHFNLAQGVFAFLFGMLAAAVYDKTHNLWGNIVLHMGGNLLSVIMVYTGFTYPEEGIYIASMCGCLVLAWAIYHFTIRPLKDPVLKELG